MNILFVAIFLCSICLQPMLLLPVKESLENPMENPDLFGGDMVGVKFLEGDDRNAIPSDAKRWPAGVIYYKIDKSLQSQTNLIEKAMKHIEQETCIRFMKRTNQTNYVNIFLGNGCYSQVGRIGGQQNLSLGKGCHAFRIVVHEIMHTIGFYHEQNRSDRDDYLSIHWENIEQKNWSQFRLLNPNQNRLYTQFDFESIMLYGPKAFSKNGKITMSSKISGSSVVYPSANKHLSPKDTFSIKKLYHCS